MAQTGFGSDPRDDDPAEGTPSEAIESLAARFEHWVTKQGLTVDPNALNERKTHHLNILRGQRWQDYGNRGDLRTGTRKCMKKGADLAVDHANGRGSPIVEKVDMDAAENGFNQWRKLLGLARARRNGEPTRRDSDFWIQGLVC